MIRWLAQMILLAAFVTLCFAFALVSNLPGPVAAEVNARPAVWPTNASYRPQLVAAYAIPWAAIVPVKCGNAVGTAFHIGGGRWLTAAHVVSNGDCVFIDGPVKLILRDDSNDIAELLGPAIPARLVVDCKPFKRDRHYLSIGYAYGIGRLNLPLIYSAFGKDPENGNGMFVGPDMHPGMSGGPLLSEEYKAAGVNSQRWPSRTRALADTHVCKGV